ncbi:MAG TPA: phosphatase PAP2 family protein [Actinomycetota bacterium]|nr:phosphatase PAP2 family protein [Actinomycetota bacterium]
MGRRLLRVAGLLGMAIATGIASSGGPVAELDLRAFRAANRDRGRPADRLFAGITELGSIWASVAAASVLAAAGRRRAAAKGLAAASVAWLAGQGLKKAFLRPRPYEADLDGVRRRIDPPRASSWPSSHPAVLLAFVLATGRELELSRGARSLMSALAGGVGVSRVYLGVHFPSDVAGGLLLGRAVADAFS